MTGISARARNAFQWRAVQLAGVQFIYFLRLLILAKLLVPEAFGLVAIALTAVGTLMRLSEVGVIPALVQRANATREEHDAGWMVGVVRAACITLLLVALAPIIARLFNEPRATAIIQVLALRPLLESLGSIGIVRLMRELRFRELALIYVPAALLDLVVAIAAASFLGVWALVLGALAGAVTSTVMSYVHAPHRPRPTLRLDAAAPLVSYGRWVLASGAIGMAGTLAMQLAISRELGAAALGVFFLATKLSLLPIEAASAVIGAVAFPMFAGLREDRAQAARAFATLLTGLNLLLLPIFALLYVLAPQLEQVLGTQWAGTTPLVHVLIVAGIVAILCELVTPLLMGWGRADRAFRLDAAQTVVLLAVLLPGVALLGAEGAAVSLLLGNVAAAALAFVWMRQMLPNALSGTGRRIAAAGAAALAAAAAAGVTAYALPPLAGLVAGGIAGAAAAGVTLWALDRGLSLGLGKFRALLPISRSREV
jgi:O-antigen/teichoic acid export membrane protein